MNIKTVHINPPIPVRSFDWCAYDADGDESGPYGWGRTERDAIQDLRDQTSFDLVCSKCGHVCAEHTQTSGYRCPGTIGPYEDNNWTPPNYQLPK